MRRRSTRSSVKLTAEKPPAESPKRRSLRSRKKRSSSHSSNEEQIAAALPIAKNLLEKEAEKTEQENRENSNSKKNLNESSTETFQQQTQEEEGSIAVKKSKGKSKSRNKSKRESSPQLVNESESNTQNVEISENVLQLTTQSTSSQKDNDNVSPSPDNQSYQIINDSNDQTTTAATKENPSLGDDNSSSEIIKTTIEDKEIIQLDQISNSNNDVQSNYSSAINKENENDRNSSTEIKNGTDDNQSENNEEKEVENSTVDTSTSIQENENIEEESEELIIKHAENDIIENDLTIVENEIVAVEEKGKEEDAEKAVESNETNEKENSKVEDEEEEMKIRKRKWGNSIVSLNLFKNNLSKIDVNTIKSLCPNGVEFLDEKDVKLETKDRRKLSESKGEKTKSERKISFDGADYYNYQRQCSVELEVEEVIEEANAEMEENAKIIAMNSKLSIVDDTASKLRPPPSPAKNPPSTILFITNLVRPFTVKQLQELLERTGKIREDNFWTDKVKSKCYVQFENEEQAEATRNALHGISWPVGNSKKLIIEYASEEEMEKARKPAPPPPPPALPSPTDNYKDSKIVIEKENDLYDPHQQQLQQQQQQQQQRQREEKVGVKSSEEKGRNHVREWQSGKEKGERDRRKRRKSVTPHDYKKQRKNHSDKEAAMADEEEEVQQKRMDDLFRRTKTSPCIYWLPLTPEEISVKEQQRLERMAEHKRRMEEKSSRNSRVDYGRGAPYRRRY